MINQQPDSISHDSDSPSAEEMTDRPWIHLTTTHDVEAWINNYDWDLRRCGAQTGAAAYGICFTLEHGGEIVMHTTPDGDVLLDVSPDAAWVTPVITAATGVEAADGQTWALPGDVMIQLVMGLSGLIGSSRPVPFNTKKKQRITW